MHILLFLVFNVPKRFILSQTTDVDATQGCCSRIQIICICNLTDVFGIGIDRM